MDKITIKQICICSTSFCTTHAHTTVLQPSWILSGTTQVSRHQKGNTNLDLLEEETEWQWHQMGHMQICSLTKTHNHATIPPLTFLQARCPSCCPTNSVKAQKGDKILRLSRLVFKICNNLYKYKTIKATTSITSYSVVMLFTVLQWPTEHLSKVLTRCKQQIQPLVDDATKLRPNLKPALFFCFPLLFLYLDQYHRQQQKNLTLYHITSHLYHGMPSTAAKMTNTK